MKLLSSFFLALSVFAMNQPQAQIPSRSPSPSSGEYKAIVEAARASAVQELKQNVGLDADVVNIAGDWAFITAELVDASGAPFTYHGTPLEQAAAAGGVSRVYAGLLQRKDDKWSSLTQVIGPTDVAWESWPGKYGAPASLFGMQ